METRSGRKRRAPSSQGGGSRRRRRRAAPDAEDAEEEAAAAATAVVAYSPSRSAIDDDVIAAQALEIQRLQEENRRLAEGASRLAEEASVSAAESRRLAEVASISAGTYYSTIDQVWGVETRPYASPALFFRLRRRRHPDYASRPQGVNYYAVTAAPAVLSQYVPAVASNPSSLGEAALLVWPTDIFGRNPNLAELAHLIPHSATHASLYFDVALCAFGFFDDDATWETLQKAIHGSVLGGTRQRDTGIKHRVPNKIRLAQQGRFFDTFPCVLIVPIRTLRQVKDWNGEGYDAVVMVGSWGESVNLTASDVGVGIGMVHAVDKTAGPEEIEVARKLLTQFVLGLAHSLGHRTGPAEFESAPPETVSNLFISMRNTLLSSAGKNGVAVPAAAARCPSSDLRVYVVQFKNAYGRYDDDSDKIRNLHPAPDPLLLAARAAVTWSRRHHQPLKAAAEPIDEQWDELDQLAAEELLEENDKRERPSDERDLARGLLRQKAANAPEKQVSRLQERQKT